MRFARTSTRAAESNVLRHTEHYYVRSVVMAQTEIHYWCCVRCGNERIYGAFEP
jgi:hypothetical protein